MFDQTVLQMGFWATWLLIPVIFEEIPMIINFIRLLHHHKIRKKTPLPDFLPVLSIIIPTYNSSKTLYRCLKSLADSDYPKNLLGIFVVDNGSKDDTFQVFAKAQTDYPQLLMRWLTSPHGKSSALNAAIYKARSQYIINIDSDGRLDKHALNNIVKKFSANPNIDALTGTILNEYFEYCQTFLAGRNIENNSNHIFTLSGAFSAFKRETLIRTYLYSTDTISEDTDMTFQIRYNLKGTISFCDDAIFYSEPISGFSELYTQRQRWQRGELEVINKYLSQVLSWKQFFSNFQIRRLIIDHTVTFLKIIWMFAIFILLGFGYSWISLLFSYAVIYLLYLFLEISSSICVYIYLGSFPEERKFYLKNIWMIFLLLFYNLLKLPTRKIACFIVILRVLTNIKGTSPFHCYNYIDQNIIYLHE
ncbi:TIGR03111 family XrtG-associated glycosyltransferase, partial [Lactobacillus crispatus]|uniref:TIGR03111 family XrtG-associated glycosyltransferase n=1 Tax=Lactobacillus crispatus TaxID=47770 RepID=UPI0030F6C11E